MRPSARKLTAKPLTIWSAWRWMQKMAWTSASSPPNSIAIRRPTTQLPLQTEPQTAKNAPMSIIPSRPMFTMPERSEKIPPIAANASGVAKRRVAAITPVVRMLSRVSASFVCSQMAPRVPARPRPIAHQPSFRSPRGTAPTPHASATNPAATGAPIERNVHGGSANQNARTPQAIPTIAIVRGSVSLRTQSVTVAPRGSVVLTERPPAGRPTHGGRACAPARCRRSGAPRRRRR